MTQAALSRLAISSQAHMDRLGVLMGQLQAAHRVQNLDQIITLSHLAGNLAMDLSLALSAEYGVAADLDSEIYDARLTVAEPFEGASV